MEKVGERVRAARKVLGWTQRQLAEAAGVHTNTVNRLEKGSRPVGKQEAKAILDAVLGRTDTSGATPPPLAGALAPDEEEICRLYRKARELGQGERLIKFAQGVVLQAEAFETSRPQPPPPGRQQGGGGAPRERAEKGGWRVIPGGCST